nr:acyl-CoA dehydrogenase family protein [Mycobacterium marseillense]
MTRLPGDFDDYRARARNWLADNMERSATSTRHTRVRGELPTPEHLSAQRALQRKLLDGGYAGITWPVEYGGQGLTPQHQRVFEQEAAGYVVPNFAPLHNTTYAVCAPVLLAHASAELKARHIPAIIAGEELWAQFFSEPDAGSDLAAIRTRAVRDGDRWILNGSKVWSSGAMLADYAMCLARTDTTKPKHKGLTWFVIPIDAPGLTIRPIREITGGAEFCEDFLDDVVVPDSQRVGEVNAGWSVTSTMLGFERSAGKTNEDRLGGPPGELPGDLVELARRRGLSADGPTRQLIARVHINDFIQRQLGRRIADQMAASDEPALASYLKLADGTFTAFRAQTTLEVAGSSGIAWADGDKAGRNAAMTYLNARARSIAGGTNEMQRNGIGERILGLEREPSADHGKPFDEVIRQSRRS